MGCASRLCTEGLSRRGPRGSCSTAREQTGRLAGSHVHVLPRPPMLTAATRTRASLSVMRVLHNFKTSGLRACVCVCDGGCYYGKIYLT